jgi:hypothetical protein
MIQLIQDYLASRRAAIEAGILPQPSTIADLYMIFEQVAKKMTVFSDWSREEA